MESVYFSPEKRVGKDIIIKTVVISRNDIKVFLSKENRLFNLYRMILKTKKISKVYGKEDFLTDEVKEEIENMFTFIVC